MTLAYGRPKCQCGCKFEHRTQPTSHDRGRRPPPFQGEVEQAPHELPCGQTAASTAAAAAGRFRTTDIAGVVGFGKVATNGLRTSSMNLSTGDSGLGCGSNISTSMNTSPMTANTAPTNGTTANSATMSSTRHTVSTRPLTA